jgi:hypothetical protein
VRYGGTVTHFFCLSTVNAFIWQSTVPRFTVGVQIVKIVLAITNENA